MKLKTSTLKISKRNIKTTAAPESKTLGAIIFAQSSVSDAG